MIIHKKCDRSLALELETHFMHITCHGLAGQLGKDTLPIFRTLTGYDTVSYFSGKGKQFAWEASYRMSFTSLTDTLEQLCSASNSVLSNES